jgi:hypothetical protein
MSNLQLSLKTKWFFMTKKLIKPEDYRSITPYWCNKFLLYNSMKMPKSFWEGYLETTKGEIKSDCSFIFFKHNIMTLGYPKKSDTDRILKLEHKGIEIRTGNPDWGAEPDKPYFVILHVML